MSETPHSNDETPWWDRALTPEEIEEQIRQQEEEALGGLAPFDLDAMQEQMRQQDEAERLDPQDYDAIAVGYARESDGKSADDYAARDSAGSSHDDHTDEADPPDDQQPDP
jgi:hypothetical protein